MSAGREGLRHLSASLLKQLVAAERVAIATPSMLPGALPLPAHAVPRARTRALLTTQRLFAAMPQTQQHAATASVAATEQLKPADSGAGATSQTESTPIQQGFSIPTLATAAGAPATGFKKTFYKRKLPSPPAIEFSCPEGRQLFQEALLDGTMTGFFKLMEQFNTQDEPAFCGLASLAMTLNALSIDPRRTWKGSWRWFHEAMLDCCRPLDAVKEEGITLYQASCLARCNGARVELVPYGSAGLSLERFRREVEAVCGSGEEHIVVSYSRKAFLQTGDGHFSPIGGYHRGRDLVLVLDVARFKYPPHWVPLPMLYHGMSYVDKVTGRPRGYMRLASNPLLDSVLLTCDVRSAPEDWRPAEAFVRSGAAALVQDLAAAGGLSAEAVVRAVVDAAPLAALDTFLVVRSGAPMAAAPPDQTGATAASGHVCPGPPPPSAPAAGAGAGALDAAAGPLGAVCDTPEAMVAAVRRASEMGNAAATDLAAATAAASAASAAGPPASSAAGSAPAVAASTSPKAKKGCGTGKTPCGSGSCGTSAVSTDGGGGAAAAAGLDHGGSTAMRALINWRGTFRSSLQPYEVLPPDHPGKGTEGLRELRLGALEVLVAETPDAANVAVETLRARMWDGVLAMATVERNDESDPIALLQLSAAGLALVMRPAACGGLPAAFRTAVVEDSDIELAVAGWNGSDERNFEESFGLQTFWCQITELPKVAKACGYSKTGIKALVQAVLEPAAAMPKSKKMGSHDWSSPTLPPEIIKQAVLDVACIEHVFRCLDGRF